MKKSLIVAAGAAAIALAALWGVAEAPAPSAPASPAAREGRAIDVSVVVDDAGRYLASVPDGSTVLEAMDRLEAEQGLDFGYAEHPALGRYVASIEGKAAAGGYYWTLYVNGRESDLGASSKTVSEGDIIEWRYEKR